MREPAPAEPAGIPGRSMRPGSEEVPGARAANFKFPLGFLWGAATSSHQVEGNCTNNDWWAWEQAGKVREPSGVACDHYNRFREDFDLARALNHNAHRFSLEWSRIEPEPGYFSRAALDHYRRMIATCLEHEVTPVVTYCHFTTPRWFAGVRRHRAPIRAIRGARGRGVPGARALVGHAQRARRPRFQELRHRPVAAG